MYGKKLRLVLATAITLSLMAAAEGNAAGYPRWQLERQRVADAVDGLPGYRIWSFLSQLWQKSGSRIDPNGLSEKAGSRIDPNGLFESSITSKDPGGQTIGTRFDLDGNH
ncbi:MAG TPA: hypothetical protein VF789_30175 [Thermoanaerobaculia bacterium]